MSDDLRWLDGTALAALVRDGEVTPLDVVDAAIRRIEADNERLNAVVIPLFEKARAVARGPRPTGPFGGVPFLVKDALCESEGDPYHQGSRVLRDADWHSPADSWLMARFRAAGLVLTGRTNAPELARSSTTEPLAHGPTRNPWNVTRSAGGSSGGSAAAVAAGMVPFAHGNDMGGSIRIPAGRCGLVGLKPSRGRTSLGPALGEYWSNLTHEHVLTRTVRDSAGVLDAIAGNAPGDPYVAPAPTRAFSAEVGADPGRLRIGFRTLRPDTGAPAHPECSAAVETTAALLERLGHHVSADAVTELDGWDSTAGMRVVIEAWNAWEVDEWGRRLGRTIDAEELEPRNSGAVTRGRALLAVDYIAALLEMQSFARRAVGWNERLDVLITPTSATPPPPIGVHAPLQLEESTEWDANSSSVFTRIFDVTGEPAVSLPLHWSAEGLPVGVQLVAPLGREDVLLRLASQLEAAQPWADRHPPDVTTA